MSGHRPAPGTDGAPAAGAAVCAPAAAVSAASLRQALDQLETCARHHAGRALSLLDEHRYSDVLAHRAQAAAYRDAARRIAAQCLAGTAPHAPGDPELHRWLDEYVLHYGARMRHHFCDGQPVGQRIVERLLGADGHGCSLQMTADAELQGWLADYVAHYHATMLGSYCDGQPVGRWIAERVACTAVAE